MRTNRILTVLAVLMVVFSLNLKSQTCYQATTPKEPINETEINLLKKMADEEKLAGDV